MPASTHTSARVRLLPVSFAHSVAFASPWREGGGNGFYYLGLGGWVVNWQAFPEDEFEARQLRTFALVCYAELMVSFSNRSFRGFAYRTFKTGMPGVF